MKISGVDDNDISYTVITNLPINSDNDEINETKKRSKIDLNPTK